MKKLLNKMLSKLPWVNANTPATKMHEHTLLIAALDKVRDVTLNGSCGLVAYSISKYFELHGIEHQIVRFSLWKYNEFHIMVRTGDFYVDAKGYTHKSMTYETLCKEHLMSMEDLCSRLRDRTRWSKDFDWRNAVRIVATLTGKDVNLWKLAQDIGTPIS